MEVEDTGLSDHFLLRLEVSMARDEPPPMPIISRLGDILTSSYFDQYCQRRAFAGRRSGPAILMNWLRCTPTPTN